VVLAIFDVAGTTCFFHSALVELDVACITFITVLLRCVQSSSGTVYAASRFERHEKRSVLPVIRYYSMVL